MVRNKKEPSYVLKLPNYSILGGNRALEDQKNEKKFEKIFQKKFLFFKIFFKKFFLQSPIAPEDQIIW